METGGGGWQLRLYTVYTVTEWRGHSRGVSVSCIWDMGQGHGHDRMKSEEPEGSVLLRIGDEMVEMLGLSKADIEELKVDSLSLFIKLLSETIYF